MGRSTYFGLGFTTLNRKALCCMYLTSLSSVFQLKSSGSKVHLISMVRQDAETVFQQIKELGMTGKGWVWIGTDGATSSTFNQQKDLERTMEGMIGTQPKNGEGSMYLNFLASWLDKDSTTYPGIVHSKKPVGVGSLFLFSCIFNCCPFLCIFLLYSVLFSCFM